MQLMQLRAHFWVGQIAIRVLFPYHRSKLDCDIRLGKMDYLGLSYVVSYVTCFT